MLAKEQHQEYVEREKHRYETIPNYGADAEGHPTLLETFIHLLAQRIDEAKDILIERFEYICNQDAASAKFMYENGTMAGYIPEEGIRSALKHGTLAVG